MWLLVRLNGVLSYLTTKSFAEGLPSGQSLAVGEINTIYRLFEFNMTLDIEYEPEKVQET